MTCPIAVMGWMVKSCNVQAPLLAVGSRVVITTTQPASFGTSNSVGALEVCLKGRIGSVAAFDEAHWDCEGQCRLRSERRRLDS